MPPRVADPIVSCVRMTRAANDLCYATLRRTGAADAAPRRHYGGSMRTLQILLAVCSLIAMPAAAIAADDCKQTDIRGEQMNCCKKSSKGAGTISCEGPQKLEGPYVCSEKIENTWECKFLTTQPMKMKK
jgi:hypothetical protein